MSLVTILTPTYNRAYKLTELFSSLQKQKEQNFEWLVVDDGSTDDTYSLMQKFKKEASFPVRYIHKDNGGKHTALNVGIATINTELTFIVDSDDTVVPDGTMLIAQYYEKYCYQPEIGIYSFLKTDAQKGIVLKMPRDEIVGEYVKNRVRENRLGDMAEVFLTKALKEFPFPVFNGEKFLSEDVVWIPMGLKYKTVFINKAIYQYEYLADGLTKNDKKIKFSSPLGSMLRGKMLMYKQCGWVANLKGAIIYDCYKREIDIQLPEVLKIREKKKKWLCIAIKPIGCYFNRKWKKKAYVNRKAF